MFPFTYTSLIAMHHWSSFRQQTETIRVYVFNIMEHSVANRKSVEMKNRAKSRVYVLNSYVKCHVSYYNNISF